MKGKKNIYSLQNEYILRFIELKATSKNEAKRLKELGLNDDQVIGYMIKNDIITKVEGDRYYANYENYKKIVMNKVKRSMGIPILLIVLSIIYYLYKIK